MISSDVQTSVLSSMLFPLSSTLLPFKALKPLIQTSIMTCTNVLYFVVHTLHSEKVQESRAKAYWYYTYIYINIDRNGADLLNDQMVEKPTSMAFTKTLSVHKLYHFFPSESKSRFHHVLIMSPYTTH